ncbi:MAG TPA: hypothetical protein VFG07_00245 [Thermoplasmata archaeon]|nr:hypothetical protein [Thermoplasmata archaeon]
MAADGAAHLRGTAPGGSGLPPAGPRRVRELLYVVGHHRSGATAFGSILAGDPKVFFVGELYRFPNPIWTSGDGRRLCSCGAPVLSCPFWNEVRRRAESEGLVEQLRRGQSTYERWSGLPRTLLASALHRPGLRRHCEAMVRFLEILADCSGADILVESGPSAARARVYYEARALGLNVRFIHMVRDGRGFMVSELRTGPDPEAPGDWIHHPLVVAGRWAWMNLAAVLLCGGDRSRYLRIRYEDLLRDPRRALEEVGRIGELDLTDTASRIESEVPIPMRHLAAGNRVRLEGGIVLHRQPPATPALPWVASAVFWVTAGWIAGLLGYHPRESYRRPG